MIVCRTRRVLTMARPAQPGRPSYLSAASGLVRSGGSLYVVADDELSIAAFPAEGDAPGEWLVAVEGELPLDPHDRKKHKADFEALVALPAMPAFPHGALLALPSGSRPRRVVAALFALDADGRATTAARTIDCSGLYVPLMARFAKLNIEGAVVTDDALLLFQRGATSACLRFDRAAIEADLARGVVGAHEPVSVRPFGLGAVDGIPLAVTDACALADSRVAFCAVAEDTDDPYVDGAFKGAAIGVLDPDGALVALERLDAPAKVEGIEARANADALELLLVTDADDVTRPGLLLEATMPLPRA